MKGRTNINGGACALQVVGKKRSEQEWRKKLSPEAYRVLREKGTEPPFSGEYWDCTEEGTYLCAGCGTPLFSSEAKFPSQSGWPSFSAPLDDSGVEYHEDKGLFSQRVEVTCHHCGGHLGHVFDDGPLPSKKRFCINSVALKLRG